MSPIPPPLLLADLFDRLRLQLPDPIVNWLTPVWILCLGATAGLVLCDVIWGILRLLSLVPAISGLSETLLARRIAIGALTVVFFGVAVGFYSTIGSRALAAAGNQAAQAAGPLDMISAL